MNASHSLWHKTGILAAVGAVVAFSGSTSIAAPPGRMALPDIPLYLPESVPPLNMLTLGRDHKLYYEAYDDHSDLDEDGLIDIRYKPDDIDYYGYFDSYKCYTYSGGQFNPDSKTSTKRCGGSSWSGDFLNYLTTSRIDALRKVLYGGYRSTDNGTTTVLERSHVPQDAHSWGKEYTSPAVDGYNINQYTPLSQPTAGSHHLFANTTPRYNTNAGQPLLRVLENRSERIWEWVSIERAVAGRCLLNGEQTNGSCGGGAISVTPTDYAVRVAVCVPGLLETNCQNYPDGNAKPIGLLQEFGESESMYFGLLSGSYAKNTSGGVLRRRIGSMRDEINYTTDGTFANFDGIIRTLNRLRTTGFDGSYQYDAVNCRWTSAARPINESECQMWGNPIGEMMYETMRYFSGKAAPTADYSIGFGAGEESQLQGGGLPVATWDDPYATRPVCARPFQTVVSDINPSYDSDQLPGSYFNGFSGDVAGLNVSAIGQDIWNREMSMAGSYFIGQSGATYDGAPTAKTVSSFGNIRGLSPEEPTKQGSYYSASVAHFGRKTDLNAVSGDQKLTTFAVALASPLPRIEIPIGNRKITFVPFGKSVAGSGITSAQGDFQPTNQIVDFYVETLTPTSGRFRVNFEDVEQGADHDMDAIVVYDYALNGNQLTINLNSEYAAGGITQHLGFVISGTTEDGIYLGVRDRDTAEVDDPDYFLDTPNATGTALPLTYSKTFTVGTTMAAASVLRDPLWYAAKWGGYDESGRATADRNDIPDSPLEWDENNDGTPDNYFLVTNALRLSEQLRSAFEDILRRTTSSSAASVNSGSISSDTRIYQATFDTGEWTGHLLSYSLDPMTGAVLPTKNWDAAEKLPAAANREIITSNQLLDFSLLGLTPRTGFNWGDLLPAKRDLLDADAGRAEQILNYIRGDGSNEGTGAGEFRVRGTKLGDIVSSSPIFVGRPPFRYRPNLETVAYEGFVNNNEDRQGMVYAGANDGMLHGFNADTGEEVFAFIPTAVFPRLRNLVDPSYSHQFYVDGPPTMGDAFFGGKWHTMLVGGLNKGGQEIYALDITDPDVLENAESNADDIIQWEFTDRSDNPLTGILGPLLGGEIREGDPDLGYTYSQPAIAKLRNGKWAAVFGNGYNSTEPDGYVGSGHAVLFVVDIETGVVIRKFDTQVGNDNGLSTPAVIDFNSDGVAEYAYAGDLYGNMWKFDLSSTNPSDWRIAFGTDAAPQPLFIARDASNNRQPITGRPEVGRGPDGAGMIVLFGTGKYLEPADKLLTPTRVQSFYGILDRNTGSGDQVSGRGDLTRQEILDELSLDPDGGGPVGTIRVRTSTSHTLGGNDGWYIDLLSPDGYQAEKQVSNPTIRSNRVIFTTLIPTIDPCGFGGSSWLMELDMHDGSYVEDGALDLNNDGVVDDNDKVDTDGDGVGDTFVSGLSSDDGEGNNEGILQSPGIVNGENEEGQAVQYKYLPGSSGNIMRVSENPGAGAAGRQSWRQLR